MRDYKFMVSLSIGFCFKYILINLRCIEIFLLPIVCQIRKGTGRNRKQRETKSEGKKKKIRKKEKKKKKLKKNK